jgi:hypothetical protein
MDYHRVGLKDNFNDLFRKIYVCLVIENQRGFIDELL